MRIEKRNKTDKEQNESTCIIGAISEVAFSKGLAFECLYPASKLSLQPNDVWQWNNCVL